MEGAKNQVGLEDPSVVAGVYAREGGGRKELEPDGVMYGKP